MDFENREGRSIQSLDDWEHLGKPASSDHWKPGRSAYELARDWIDGDAADAVTALLSSRHEFSGIALIDAVAEKRTRFDGDSHGPRNHDLLVRAAMPSGNPVTVAIEGKADEAFDAPLWQYRERLSDVPKTPGPSFASTPLYIAGSARRWLPIGPSRR